MAARRYLDARLAIGLLLVAVSVVGVVGLVAALDHRVPVYVAANAIVPGERLSDAALVEKHMLLDDAEELYLRVGQAGSEDLVVVRPIRAGELVPVSALGDAGGVGLTAVVVSPTAALSSAVVAGSSVELWAAESSRAGEASVPPVTLVPDAIVVEVSEESGFVSVGSTSSVELLIPRDKLALVLQAIADDSALAVVPAGVPWSPT